MMRLTTIGNSKGVLIPKAWVQQLGLEGCELSLSLRDGGVLIQPKKNNLRADWPEKIALALKQHPHDIDDEWLNSDLTDE